MHAFERPDLRRLRCLCIRQAPRFTIANGPLMACLPSLSFRLQLRLRTPRRDRHSCGMALDTYSSRALNDFAS